MEPHVINSNTINNNASFWSFGLLRPLKSLSLAFLHSGAFVLGMYCIKGTSDNSQRNEWPVVLKRILASSISTFSSFLISPPLLRVDYDSRRDYFKQLFLPRPLTVVKLVGTLFAGVLVEWGVHFGARFIKKFNDKENIKKEDDDYDMTFRKTLSSPSSTAPPLSITILRDLLVAPITEEIVFRGIVQGNCLRQVFATTKQNNDLLLVCPNSVVSSTNSSFTTTSTTTSTVIIIRTFISSLIFSAAHAHHGFSRCSLTNKIKCDTSTCIRHMVSPMMFGLLSGCLFEKGVGLLWIAAAHSFCNLVGPPKWSSVVVDDDVVKQVFLKNSSDGYNESERREKIVNKLFLMIHVGCVGAFGYGVWRW